MSRGLSAWRPAERGDGPTSRTSYRAEPSSAVWMRSKGFFTCDGDWKLSVGLSLELGFEGSIFLRSIKRPALVISCSWPAIYSFLGVFWLACLLLMGRSSLKDTFTLGGGGWPIMRGELMESWSSPADSVW